MLAAGRPPAGSPLRPPSDQPISLFTANTTSILTTARAQSRLENPADLRTARVGAAALSSGAEYLDRQNVTHRTYATVTDALDALRDGQLDAVVSNLPVLRFHVLQGYSNAIRLGATPLAENYMGMAVPPGSPLREELDRAILVVTARAEWSATIARYLGPD